MIPATAKTLGGDDAMSEIYCPACGETTVDETMEYPLCPGDVIHWECGCGTYWDITINFVEHVEVTR